MLMFYAEKIGKTVETGKSNFSEKRSKKKTNWPTVLTSREIKFSKTNMYISVSFSRKAGDQVDDCMLKNK